MIGKPFENPCGKIEKFKEQCKESGENCWPSRLSPPLKENKRDGKITPDEFDQELGKLAGPELDKLMYDVQHHPLTRTKE